MDGFMAEIKPEDRLLEAAETDISLVSTTDGRDEWITKACTDPKDTNSFCIAGGTMELARQKKLPLLTREFQ